MSWLPFVLLLLVLVGLLGSGYWIWQGYEFSRAFRLLKAGQYAEVIPHTERLIAFGPDKMRARVIQVRALIEIDAKGSIEELTTLLAQGSAKDHPEIGLAFLQLQLDADRLDGVDEVLQELRTKQAANPEFLLLQAKIQIRREEQREAFSTLEQLLSVDSQNEEALLLRGQLLLRQNNRAADIQAKSNLRQASKHKGEVGMSALLTLAASPGIPLFDSDREWLMRRIREHSRGTPISRLLADTQQLNLEPGKRAAIIAEAIRREGAKEPELVAKWLLSNSAYAELLVFLQSPASGQLDETGRWSAQLMAYMQSNDLENASRLLNRADQPISEARRTTLLAFIGSGQDTANSKQATQLWRDAYAQAEEDGAFNELLALGQLALRKGWQEEAAACLKTAIAAAKNSREELAAIPLYLAALTMQGKTADALVVVHRSLELSPDDVGMLNNQYYLEALLDDPADADPHRIAPLVEQSPASVMRSTYSFLLWKAGLLDQAQEQFDLLNKQYLSIGSCRLGGLLIAVDQKDYPAAANLMKGLDPAVLMPEEAVLYDQAKSVLEAHQAL
ncbi:hypothetical protein [Cerasicoccus arenae]|nr:hypothetical protein [Cerasicoccus arenae]MBK1857430.1 hypothetical protein [Cerasicoccus arenae]